MILLVFSDDLNLSFTPESNSHPSHQFHRRDREFLLCNPATDRVPTNADDLCDFNRRMSSHLNNGIGLFDLSTKKRTRMGTFNAPIRGNQRISQKLGRVLLHGLVVSEVACPTFRTLRKTWKSTAQLVTKLSEWASSPSALAPGSRYGITMGCGHPPITVRGDGRGTRPLTPILCAHILCR